MSPRTPKFSPARVPLYTPSLTPTAKTPKTDREVVLVVEDDTTTREIMCHLLGRSFPGVEVVPARDGVEAKITHTYPYIPITCIHTHTHIESHISAHT
jgi:hypothetical protein